MRNSACWIIKSEVKKERIELLTLAPQGHSRARGKPLVLSGVGGGGGWGGWVGWGGGRGGWGGGVGAVGGAVGLEERKRMCW